MKRFAIGFAKLAALTGLLFVAPSLAQSPSGTGVEVQDCIVRFAAEVKVPALETGQLAELTVAVNDMVEVGSPLARLNDHTLLNRRRAIASELEMARRDSVDNTEVRYAELALAEAEAELETSQLIQSDSVGAIPRVQLRRMKLAVEGGEVEVTLAKKKLARKQLEVELREADLSVIDDQLKNLQVESPAKGVVLEVARARGEWMAKGDTLATIGQIDRLHVHALANSRDLPPADCRGMPVSVHWTDPTTNQERSLRGKVLSVDPQMLPGGRFRLHAEIINETWDHNPSQWQLLPGADVRMKVFTSAATALKRNLNAPTTR
jgi:multidrug efflux pump subunit AcrA (membrane-fusion protein)